MHSLPWNILEYLADDLIQQKWWIDHYFVVNQTNQVTEIIEADPLFLHPIRVLYPVLNVVDHKMKEQGVLIRPSALSDQP